MIGTMKPCDRKRSGRQLSVRTQKAKVQSSKGKKSKNNCPKADFREMKIVPNVTYFKKLLDTCIAIRDALVIS